MLSQLIFILCILNAIAIDKKCNIPVQKYSNKLTRGICINEYVFKPKLINCSIFSSICQTKPYTRQVSKVCYMNIVELIYKSGICITGSDNKNSTCTDGFYSISFSEECIR